MSFVLMLIGLLATGLGAILIGFGIPINEFSLGNTLILAGTVVAAGGLVIFAISRAVAQLSRIADILNSRPLASTLAAGPDPHDPSHPDLGRAAPRAPAPARGRAEPGAAGGRTPMQADPFEIPPEIEPARPSPAAGPRAAAPVVEIPDEPPAPRAPARPAAEPAAPEPAGVRRGQAPLQSLRRPEPRRPAPADNPVRGCCSMSGRKRRARRPPASRTDLGHAPEPARAEPVSVLKSGVVDGMAYTLYTDGSIEAELAQGVVRFGSIEELRNHLEKSA